MARRIPSWLVLVGGSSALLLACASFEPEDTPRTVGGAPSASTGTGSSGGASSDAAAPGQGSPDAASSPDAALDGAADGDEPGECNDLSQLAVDVPLELGNGTPDSATGGDANGMWALAAVKIYAPLLPVQKTVSATTLRIDNLAYQMRVGGSHSNGNAAISNATIVLTPTCGAGSELTGTTFSYVASGAKLQVFGLLAVAGVPGSPFTVEYRFDRR